MSDTNDIKLYKRRWLIMGLFMLYTLTTGVHWVEFSSINNIICKYYKISPTLVEWTSIVYMASYVLVVFPSIYVMDHFGIRITIIIASAGTCAGAYIKIMSVAPDKFYVLMIGQTLLAIFSVFTFGIAARFTAIWFGKDEISQAGALALLGDQVGSTLSFLLPTLIVQDTSDIVQLEYEMLTLHITLATGSTLTLIAMIMFFTEQPKRPPSIAQARQKELQVENIWESIMRMFSKRSFLLITMSYSISLAISNAICTLLNELVLNNFSENYLKDAGHVGGLYMIAGTISALVIGYILDKTGKFKENAVILTIAGSASLAFMTVALKTSSILGVYITTTMLGTFLQGYYATGIQTCIEVTYPIPENISTATMFLFSQIICIGLIPLYSFIMKTYGDLIANIGMVSFLLLSSVLACFIPQNLKRQNIEHQAISVQKDSLLMI